MTAAEPPEDAESIPGRCARGSLGMVTAEAAAVLPLLCAVALAMVWLICVGVTQVRVVDAARDAARAIARGEDEAAAVAAARRTAGGAASVEVSRSDGLVSVRVSEAASAPGWLLVPLPSVRLSAESQVEDEDDIRSR